MDRTCINCGADGRAIAERDALREAVRAVAGVTCSTRSDGEVRERCNQIARAALAKMGGQ